MKKIMCVFATIGFFASSGSVQANEVNGDYVCVTYDAVEKKNLYSAWQYRITDTHVLRPSQQVGKDGLEIVYRNKDYIVAAPPQGKAGTLLLLSLTTEKLIIGRFWGYGPQPNKLQKCDKIRPFK
jgi:hypothetical protein